MLSAVSAVEIAVKDIKIYVFFITSNIPAFFAAKAAGSNVTRSFCPTFDGFFYGVTAPTPHTIYIIFALKSTMSLYFIMC